MEVDKSTVPGLVALEQGRVELMALNVVGTGLLPELVTVGVRGLVADGHFALEVGMTSLLGLQKM